MPFKKLKTSRAFRLAVIAASAGLALILATVILTLAFSGEKEPDSATLQAAAAGKLDARYGNLYSIVAFHPGHALSQPPAPQAAPIAAAPTRPIDDSPISAVPAPAIAGAPPAPRKSARAKDGRLYYDASVTARLAEPLYIPVNAPKFLEGEMKLDTSAARKIEQILSGPGAARIRELAGADTASDSLASMQLIREVARGGMRIEFAATLAAEPVRDGWHVEVLSFEPRTPPPQGEVLGKFSGRLLDVSRESDLATIRRLAAQGDDALRRVEQARERYRAELAANASRAIAAHLSQLTPGALFTGRAIIPARSETPALSLEIVSIDRAASTLSAVLRSDGSWSDARPLDARYAYNTETGAFTIAFAARDGVPLASSAGVVINDGKPFRLSLLLDGAELSGDTGAWSCKLTRVPDANRAATIAAFTSSEKKLLDATRPGLVYRVRQLTGGADSAADTTIGPRDFILRFISQDPLTGTLTATLSDSNDQSPVELQGSVITSAHRAGGYPVRLFTVVDAARPAAATPVGLSLRQLGDNQFTGMMRSRETVAVALDPADPRALAQVSQKLAARRDAVLAALREGIVCDGIAKAGNATATTRVRLRITQYQPAATSADVAAEIDSIEMPGVKRALRGALNATTGELRFTTAEGTLNTGGALREPWFTSRDDFVFQLKLISGELAGKIFPASAASAAATAAAATADATAATWSVAFSLDGRPATLLPTDSLPAKDGAYIWTGAAWKQLPANNAHVVHSTLQKVGGLWGSAVSLIKTRAEKQDTGTLTFDGDEAPPAVSGRDVILAFSGEYKRYEGVPAGQIPIEVTALELKSKGRKRVAELDRLGDAAASFGKKRELAVVDQVVLHTYIVRVVRPLPPGRYTISAPDQAFEFEVSP